MQKKLSIVIPVYNIKDYLSRCINSFADDIHNIHEVLLIDDGSTDGSAELCNEWAIKYAQIRCIHKENGGVSSARNVGIKEATGDYIYFIDGDDYLEEHAIVEMLEDMEEPADCYLYGYHYWTDNAGKSVDKIINPLDQPGVCKGRNEILDLISKFMGNSMDKIYTWFSTGKLLSNQELGSVWRLIFSKQIIIKNNVYFDENLQLAEDQMYIVSYLNCCNTCKIIHDAHYNYIVREASASHVRRNYHNAINNKIKLFKIREKISEEYPELQPMWQGSAVLSAVQMAAQASAKGQWGFKEFKKFCEMKSIRNAFAKLKLKNAPFKFKIALGLIKKKMYLTMFVACKILNTLNIGLYPTA